MPDWQFFHKLEPYEARLAAMQTHVHAMQKGQADEAIWVLSHEAVYTGGTSATASDILSKSDIPFVETGRGGQWTYHGPGMRIAYPMLDLNKRAADLRLYVHQLEAWVIDILACFAVEGHRREGLPGVWVKREDGSGYDKIAALGVRVSKWITAHGFAINNAPSLSAYDAIVPCGVTDAGVTSLAALGQDISDAELDMAIQDCFATHFGEASPMAWRP